MTILLGRKALEGEPKMKIKMKNAGGGSGIRVPMPNGEDIKIIIKRS